MCVMNYIVIEGNIGAGKTSLALKFARDLNARLILEKFEENPFLPKFYDQPEKYSFPLELSFLAERYKQHKDELMSRDMFAPLAIADYHLAKSLIFAGITLPADELRLYKQLYGIVHQHLPIPDLYLYLHSSVEKLIENIKKRGRTFERNIDPEYLEKLQGGYFNFMKSHPGLKILILDVTNVDFLSSKEDYEKIKQAVFDRGYSPGLNWYKL